MSRVLHECMRCVLVYPIPSYTPSNECFDVLVERCLESLSEPRGIGGIGGIEGIENIEDIVGIDGIDGINDVEGIARGV